MDTEWAGKNIVYFDEIDSTNNRAKELGEKDGAHGTLFVADRQVAGKGRRGHVGIPKRNQHLYDNSAPTRSDTDKGTDADISYGTECGRRYPGSDRHGDWNQIANDIVMNKKKVCGILTEMSTRRLIISTMWSSV